MASSSTSRKRQRLNESGNAFEEVIGSSVTASSSSTQNFLSYDVFINHRDCDVKETLVKDIYEALTRREVKVFSENKALGAGDFIPIEVQEGMKSALLHIAIFSPRYAESPWCMAELSFMLETKKKIIPIFYRVHPSDLRWVAEGKGIYASTFDKHEKKDRYSPNKLQEWKSALERVSVVSGYIINNDDQWKQVLEELENLLAKVMKQPLLVSKDPLFGIEETVNDFQTKTIRSASYDDSAQIVGIVGMGGCGKTTLAKEVYNRKRASIRSTFLYDVRDEASKNLLPKLQKKLLEDLGIYVYHSSFENIYEGMDIIAYRLRSVSMLVVLDDVDNQEQIDALVPPKHSLGSGSLIIITTRDLNVLTSAGISPSSIYEMKELDPSYSKELFCFHAFPNRDPPREFEELVEKSLSTCQGLPLSLKVFGRQLCDKSKEYWESQLNEFSKVLPKGIVSILKTSYDALDPEDQELFLDIACFFIGERRSLVIEVWDGLGQGGVYRLETLKDKCLVELDQNNRIRMHGHIRDFGREIAKRKSPYRIWLQGQIYNSSPQAKEEMHIRGIMAATTSFAEVFCSSNDGPFKKCVDVLESSSLPLKLLVLKDKLFSRKIGELSKGLVWLRWFDFDQAYLPSYLSLGNLRVLELYQVQRIETLWENNRTPPLQLRELIIEEQIYGSHNGSFQSFPKSIGTLKHLKKLVIRCRKEYSFSSLPDEFCDLESLEHLELECFETLSSLPSRFGNLTNLLHLTLKCLSSLRCLPVSFKQLTCLQYLDLSYCSRLNFTVENLDVFENITKLEYLSFAYCEELEALPHHITNQPFLREFNCSCTSIRNVPPNICKLYKLEVMTIRSKVLRSLPTTFGDLSCLNELYIVSCKDLISLPPSFGNLSKLTTLHITGCSSLECLPASFGNLSSLTTLLVCSCSRLECLPPSFGNLSSLTTLHIYNCQRLQSFPDSVRRLNLLEEVEMVNLGVKSLPDTYGQLANLRKLYIRSCALRELIFRSGSASALCSLKEITLENTLVATVSISEDCYSLQTLDIKYNKELMEIETLPRTLKHLTVKGCPRLEKLPSYAYLTSLKDLEIDGHNKLEKIENLEQLMSLETLRVTRSGSKVPRLAGIEQIQRRLRTVELSADNISDLEPCIQTIKRWPYEMVIWGRAVDVAKSILTDFTFPQLTVVHSVSDKDMSFVKCELTCRRMHSSNAAIVCFLFNCPPLDCEVCIQTGLYSWSTLEMTEGKWVWIGVFDSSTIKEYTIPTCSGLKIEKGMIAVGQERRVQEVFKALTLVLQG